MKKILFLLLILTSFKSFAQAPNLSMYTKEVYIHHKDTMPYRILLPLNYDESKTYPLIIFLHGSGERGNDNEAQLGHGGILFLQDSIRIKYPAIVVFPQCAKNSFWSNIKVSTENNMQVFTFDADGKPTAAMKLLLRLIPNLQHNYSIDKHRRYVGGLSMGGMGTFEIVKRKPRIFAAAITICGAADTVIAPALQHTAWWIFQGLKDNVVNPKYSINIAAAIKKTGAEVRINLYPEANHNSWDNALAEKDLLPWLFSHSN